MNRLAPFLLLTAACTSSVATTTATVATTPIVTSTTVEVTPPLTNCPKPPYEIGTLPAKVSDTSVAADTVATDDYTSIPGTRSSIWLDGDGNLGVALIRGSLPPHEWPSERGEVEIDGVRAVAGPFADGSWVIGWYEEPRDRCDLYTMVFYPPVTPDEVRVTLESMNRVAG